MRYLATILITLLLAVPAMSVELFRYRGAAKDGGTLEYVFEGGEQNSPNAVAKEKAADRRGFHDDFLSRAGRRTGDAGISDNASPVLAHLLFRHDQRTMRQMYFVVLLPDGTVVEPRVEKRL
jgi:hypothetical protein